MNTATQLKSRSALLTALGVLLICAGGFVLLAAFNDARLTDDELTQRLHVPAAQYENALASVGENRAKNQVVSMLAGGGLVVAGAIALGVGIRPRYNENP